MLRNILIIDHVQHRPACTYPRLSVFPFGTRVRGNVAAVIHFPSSKGGIMEYKYVLLSFPCVAGLNPKVFFINKSILLDLVRQLHVDVRHGKVDL